MAHPKPPIPPEPEGWPDMPRPIYDREGEEISSWEWACLLEDRDYVVVEQTTIGPTEVSTVWLGLDHAFGGPVPIIFETAVFDLDDDERRRSEIDGGRFPTEAAARRYHEEVVEALTLRPLPEAARESGSAGDAPPPGSA